MPDEVGSRPHVLVATPWWPSTASDPFGSFVRDQAGALVRAGAVVEVGVLRLARPDRPSRSAAPLPGGDDRAVTVVRGPWLPYRAGYDLLLRGWTSGLARTVAAHRGLLRRGAVVVVHTQDLAVPAARALARTGVPWVVVAHGEEPDSPRYARADRRRAYAAALAAAARVVAVGPGLARVLRAEAPGADVRVVGNGYDRTLVEQVLADAAPSGAGPRVVSVSNLNAGKGVALVLDALADRARRGLAVPAYDVVGDGPDRAALERRAADLGLGARVRFHGALPRAAALRVVRGAAGFVLPSAPEAHGIAYLEAMALGVPPVAIAGEGPSAFVEDGETGFLVERRVPAVVAALDRLVDDPATSSRLGAAAARRAAGLGWDAAARALLEALPPPRPARRGPVPTWVSLYVEPTPYVVAKQDAVEAAGGVRLRRAFLATDASQAWGADARARAQDVLDRPSRVAGLAFDLLRGRYAGLHAAGWGGRRALPLLLASAWLGRRPLAIESDTHRSASRGLRAAVRRAYLRGLDRRVRAWLPAGSPQAEHLVASAAPRAPVVVEHMTTDTATLRAEADLAGADAPARFRAALGIPAGAALVLAVGRLAPEKGVGDLLDAVGRLARSGRDVHLAWLGPGTVDPAAATGLDPARLHAPGRVPWRALVPAYLAADVFALPSHAEPWGLVVNEALLLGCPVVVTDAVGCARDLVAGPATGLVVPARAPAALAAALAAVLDAGGRRSPFAGRARATGAAWSVERAGATVARALRREGGRRPC